MKRKPWPLVVLSLFTFFMPVINIFINATLNNVSAADYVHFFIESNDIWSIINFFFLLPLAAICIFFMKKWTYPIFIGIFIFLFVNSFYNWNKYFTDVIPIWGILIFSFGYVFLVTYYTLPSVREVYFNKKIRWWENRPRFFLNIPSKIIYREKEYSCLLSDISEGGAFINTDKKIEFHDNLALQINHNNHKGDIRGRIVHHVSPSGYGIEFISNKEEKKMIKSLTKELHREKYPTRDKLEPAWVSFKSWLKELTKGKGFTPEKK